jgi:hypothetical protein
VAAVVEVKVVQLGRCHRVLEGRADAPVGPRPTLARLGPAATAPRVSPSRRACAPHSAPSAGGTPACPVSGARRPGPGGPRGDVPGTTQASTSPPRRSSPHQLHEGDPEGLREFLEHPHLISDVSSRGVPRPPPEHGLRDPLHGLNRAQTGTARPPPRVTCWRRPGPISAMADWWARTPGLAATRRAGRPPPRCRTGRRSPPAGPARWPAGEPGRRRRSPWWSE